MPRRPMLIRSFQETQQKVPLRLALFRYISISLWHDYYDIYGFMALFIGNNMTWNGME